ncbi:Trafficking protein particle complex subunit 12 [Madurella mycetomatis]|uniref:Trafficking protein particle complex subunit 12 n=1 Tax=Madurella mycetomatis TaxID=100816 RepID=A0A175W458_9PEZI|nr:Trafficking protein particle complex subunit 12 [Madurella mycetomatis]
MAAMSLKRGAGPPRPKDFSYLLRPEIYHPLTPLNVPPPFRNSPKQPAPDTPIPDLLARGQFRAAAIAATQALTGTGSAPPPDPADHARIFELLYTRLACLKLVDATALAAQEVKALGDLNSAFYYHQDDAGPATPASSTSAAAASPSYPAHLVPWDLRVLSVRLQALGFGDPRRAVMCYYDLARETRARLAEARKGHDFSGAEVWRERLADLGVRVAGALVEMGDLTGAACHLGTLRDGGQMQMRRALLWLQLGDVEAARECLARGGGNAVEEKVVRALCEMADGEYEAAVERWRELRDEVDDEMVGVNLAVCLLYVGKMQEGKALLESLVDAGRNSHTLLFNLTTMYELCTERSRPLKVKLSEKVASMDETADGWEKTNADFKL